MAKRVHSRGFVWEPEHDALLIKRYKEGVETAAIADELNKKYPGYKRTSPGVLARLGRLSKTKNVGFPRKGKQKNTKRGGRSPVWDKKEEALLVKLYREGKHFNNIKAEINKAFKNNRSDFGIRKRICTLRDAGVDTGERRRRKGRKDKTPKLARAIPGNWSAENGEKRTLTIDLGKKGTASIVLEGPIILNAELIEQLASMLARAAVTV